VVLKDQTFGVFAIRIREEALKLLRVIQTFLGVRKNTSEVRNCIKIGHTTHFFKI
jgi:hypothetical protein